MNNIFSAKRRKSLSHIGGFLADYINSELKCRAGLMKPTKSYAAICNGTFQYILKQLDEHKTSYLDEQELGTWESAVSVLTNPESLGDVFEIGVLLSSLMNDAKGIMLLAETVFYTENSLDDHWQENPIKEYEAIRLLGLTRTWVTGYAAAQDLDVVRNQTGIVISQKVTEVQDPFGICPRPASSSGTIVGEVVRADSAYSWVNIRSTVRTPFQVADSTKGFDMEESENDKRALQEVQQYSAQPVISAAAAEEVSSDDDWGGLEREFKCSSEG